MVEVEGGGEEVYELEGKRGGFSLVGCEGEGRDGGEEGGRSGGGGRKYFEFEFETGVAAVEGFGGVGGVGGRGFGG